MIRIVWTIWVAFLLLLVLGCEDSDPGQPSVSIISPQEGVDINAQTVEVSIELENVDDGTETYFKLNSHPAALVPRPMFTIEGLVDDEYELVVYISGAGNIISSDTVHFKISGQGPFDVVIDGGTGSGDYLTGESVAISSNAYTYPFLFSHWSGDNFLLTDSTLESTSFEVEDSDVYLKSESIVDPSYTIEVNVINGEGSGSYHPGEDVNIASSLEEPVYFTHWSGDNEVLEDTTLVSTQFVADIFNVELKANGVVHDVSFSNHLFPLIQTNCNSVGCHDASSEPAFTAYETIAAFGENIVLKTQNRNMPPPLYGSLTEEELEIIRVWVEEGMQNN